MSRINRYKTRERANEGIKVKLLDPSTGHIGEDWVEVVSSLSDAFREARDKALQDAGATAGVGDEKARKDVIDEVKTKMHAALVKAWSFEDACTLDNVKAWLLKAQKASQAIMVASTQDERFFGKPSTDSSDGAKAK